MANGKPVPDGAQAAFEKLPPVMAKADQLSGQIARAVIDLAETVALQGREGESFPAVVTDVDERGARIQLRSPAVVARVKANGLRPGQQLTVKLERADPGTRTVRFSALD